MKISTLMQIEFGLHKVIANKKVSVNPKNLQVYLRQCIKNLLFASGAERIRPILVNTGYQLISGINNNKDVLELSLCTELFHTAALIHDDIMDNAKTRRGAQTIHEFFKEEYLKNISSRVRPAGQDFARTIKEAEDYGKNMAILAGDLSLIWADEVFYSSKIDKIALFRAKTYFDSLREEVIFGQSMDLVLPTEKNVGEADILRMYEYKTARYTLEKPLLIGASLAGAGESALKMLSDFAIPVGIAFQIQDDILGVFGINTGKDRDSDIKEGKSTLLSITTWNMVLGTNNKKRINDVLGNKNASLEEIKWVKEQMVETGALKYCQQKAKKLINQGKKALLEYNGKLDKEAKQYLLTLADKCIERNR